MGCYNIQQIGIITIQYGIFYLPNGISLNDGGCEGFFILPDKEFLLWTGKMFLGSDSGNTFQNDA